MGSFDAPFMPAAAGADYPDQAHGEMLVSPS
jgi:hypothetical protein